MSSPLALILAVGHICAWAGSGAGTPGTPLASASEPQRKEARSQAADRAARAALNTAPARTKIGRVRGVRIASTVRFHTAPDDAYSMKVSFGFPERARIILSSSGGASERYLLGSTLMGRDYAERTAPETSESFVLEGPGRTETAIDIELRRALFMWPDAPAFTGKGTTFSAQLGELGVILATVDEETGLPTRMRTFGADGRAGVEFHSIRFAEVPEGGEASNAGVQVPRPWPRSFVFAAGGRDLWAETVESAQYNWLFTDAWFLPSDRLTAVMGSKTTGKLRVRALGGAWIHRQPLVADPARGADDLQTIADNAARSWNAFRQTVKNSFQQPPSVFVSPHIALVLDSDGRPVAAEFEAVAPATQTPSGENWSWRGPTNIWAHPLGPIEADAGEGILVEGQKALDIATAPRVQGATPPSTKTRGERRLRLRVGDKILGGRSSTVAVELELTAPAATDTVAPEGTAPADQTPKR